MQRTTCTAVLPSKFTLSEAVASGSFLVLSGPPPFLCCGGFIQSLTVRPSGFPCIQAGVRYPSHAWAPLAAALSRGACHGAAMWGHLEVSFASADPNKQPSGLPTLAAVYHDRRTT